MWGGEASTSGNGGGSQCSKGMEEVLGLGFMAGGLRSICESFNANVECWTFRLVYLAGGMGGRLSVMHLSLGFGYPD